MANSGKKIQSLWPLPGGNKRYLHTLDQIIKWASTTTELNRQDVINWLISEYNVSEKTAPGYLQVVTAMGVFDSHSDGRLTLTTFGRKLLEADQQTAARLVTERFMQDYLAFPEVISIYAQANGPIHISEMVETLQPLFSQWTTETQFEYRALWLLSLGCLQQMSGRNYQITKFGREIAGRFPPAENLPEPSGVTVQPSQEITTISEKKLVDDLQAHIDNLEKGAIDSQNPQHFEKAVAQAFQFLGFAVDQLGESGDTDVLANAYIGDRSYSVIVDAKARHDGKLQDLEVYTIKDHLDKNHADFAVVVAGRFATGKVERHASENHVVLLSVPLLVDWMRLHARTPLNLDVYQHMFTTSGILEAVPTVLKTAYENKANWAHLLVDLLELIQETYGHGLLQSLPSHHLFTMLVTRLRGVRYSSQEVGEAVSFLTHPIIQAALREEDQSIALAMNREALARTLRSLADQIETIESETLE